MSATFARPQTTGERPLNHRLLRTCPCCQTAAPAASLARRNFLAGGIVALGLGASTAAAAQTKARARIDVHHHYVPPVQAAAIVKHGGKPPQWPLQCSFDDRERAGVATAVLSLGPAGVWFGDVEEGRTLARACNEYG